MEFGGKMGACSKTGCSTYEAMQTSCVDLRTTATANVRLAEINTQTHANGHVVRLTIYTVALSHEK